VSPKKSRWLRGLFGGSNGSTIACVHVDRGGLPEFRYHPDPVATGSVVAEEVDCACCGQRRPFTYVGPVYAVENLRRVLCPWCIADGRAAAMFDAQFTDVWWRVPADVGDDATEEVLRRTPGLQGGSRSTGYTTAATPQSSTVLSAPRSWPGCPIPWKT
jgi:Uncharacterised protein family (UPF0167)